MGTFAKLAVCIVVYLVGFISNSIYREFHHLYPSPALGTQIGFVLAVACWFVLPRKQ